MQSREGCRSVSETFDLVVHGGRLVSSSGEREGVLAVMDGRVSAILPRDARPSAERLIDASGLHVFPGIIDTHVHTRHPGVAAREDITSGTTAAAAGGITTLLEMPISTIAVNSADAVERRQAAMQPGALVDFGLYGGAGQENVDAIAEQARAGVVGFKTFLQPPPPARLGEFEGLWCTDTATLRDLLSATAATGLPHAFHCEDAALFTALQARLEAAGRYDGLAHADSRPPVVEERSVAALVPLAAEARARMHVVHLSSPRSAQLVLDARRRGVDVTAETCPPYLFFSCEKLETLRGFAKCNPPLRERDDVEGLWRYLAAGAVDVVGTDHSPFLDEEKRRGDANIFLAPPGLCGLEVALPLMLTAVHEGRLPLEQLVSLMSERAASLFGLPRKGRLEPGCDADFVLVDRAHTWTFDHTRARTKSKENMRIYDGVTLVGRVVSTFLRGRPVVEDGEVVGRPGAGRFVRPERHDAASVH